MPSSRTKLALQNARSRYPQDHNSDLRAYLVDIMPRDQGMPLSTIVRDFTQRCRDEGVAAARYAGRAQGLVLQLLRELEEVDCANRQTHTFKGAKLDEPLWGGVAFKPYQRRAEARKSLMPEVVLCDEVPWHAVMLREIEQMRGNLNRMEAQVQAAVTLERKARG